MSIVFAVTLLLLAWVLSCFGSSQYPAPAGISAAQQGQPVNQNGKPLQLEAVLGVVSVINTELQRRKDAFKGYGKESGAASDTAGQQPVAAVQGSACLGLVGRLSVREPYSVLPARASNE